MAGVKRLEDLEVYQLAERLSDYVWDVVAGWDWFARRIVGVQLVDAVDSTPANLAEGYGRYYYKENRLFCYYARGSYQETRNWLRRATRRNLLAPDQIEHIRTLTDPLGPKLNAYINSIGPTEADTGEDPEPETARQKENPEQPGAKPE